MLKITAISASTAEKKTNLEDATAFVFGGDGKAKESAAAAVLRVLRAAPRKSVEVAAHAAAMLSPAELAAIERRCGVALVIMRSAVEVYGLSHGDEEGDEEPCAEAAERVRELVGTVFYSLGFCFCYFWSLVKFLRVKR